MNLNERLEMVFREVFDNEELTLSDETTSRDIAGWDSVAHINLMFGIEQAFGIQFKGNELAEFENIGALRAFLSNGKSD
jgi:acyl carrier protein